MAIFLAENEEDDEEAVAFFIAFVDTDTSRNGENDADDCGHCKIASRSAAGC